MAKIAFEGVKGYDSQTAISISNDKLSEFGVKHSTIMGEQHRLYTEFAKTGQQLTMDTMKNIEIDAMTRSGVPVDYATNAVEKAIADLEKNGVTQPIHILWN